MLDSAFFLQRDIFISYKKAALKQCVVKRPIQTNGNGIFLIVHCLLLMFRHDKTVSEGCGLGRSGLSDHRHASRNIWWAFVHRAVSQRCWHRWSRHHHNPTGEQQHSDTWNAVHVPGSCFHILWSALHYKNKILKKDSNKKICIKKNSLFLIMSSDVLTCEEQEAFTLNWKLKK